MPEKEAIDLDLMTHGRVCAKCGLLVSAKADVCPNDGTKLLAKMAESSHLGGKYRFLEKLAEGGMAAVYKVEHDLLHHELAVKLMHPHVVTEETLERFKREAKATMGLQHPGIVPVHDFGISEHGQAFIVMDFARGQTLQQRIAQGPLPAQTCLSIFQQLAEALSYAHAHGIIHRDIKPSNIILEETCDGQVKARILDFGIARFIHDDASKSVTMTGEIIGSPRYMSPEQCSGQVLDVRSDIYSLGATIFEAVTARHLFNATTTVEMIFKHINEEPLTKEVLSQQNLPPGFESVIQRCLAKDRTDRFASMEELCQAIDDVKSGHGYCAPSSAVPDKQITTARSKAPLWILASAITAALAVVLISLLTIRLSTQAPVATTNPSQIQASTDPNKFSAPVTDLSGSKFSVAALQTLDAKVKILRLVASSVTDDDLLLLRNVPKLSSLELQQTAVSNKGVSKLLSTGLTSLWWLDLSDTRVNNACLPDIGKLTKLQYILLDRTQISDGDELKALGSTSVVELYLAGTRIGDDSLAALAECRRLKGIDLSGTKVTANGLRRLRALPRLEWVLLLHNPSITEADIVELGKYMPEVYFQKHDPAKKQELSWPMETK